MDRLQQSFGTSLTKEMADEAFERHARDFSKEIRREKGHHEDDFIYRMIAESEEGEVYFHFTLDEDPEDPQIMIESAHKPR